MSVLRAFNAVKISVKLPVIIVGVGILASAISSYIGYSEATHLMQSQNHERLNVIVENRKNQIETWYNSIASDLKSLSAKPFALSALRQYDAAWNALGGNQTETLQQLYIHNNPNPMGQKEKLDAATDGSAYSQTHAQLHPFFRNYLQQKGYYDIFLFNKQGDVVYSVFKELDFASNVVKGKWADTDLGTVFKSVRDAGQPGDVKFVDFKPYAPSNNVPASFMATGLYDEQGNFAGAVAFQMPIGTLNAAMQNASGLGETGETFLVGADYMMRSDSRFSKESTILAKKVENTLIKAALDGKHGVDDVVLHDVDHVQAYTPVLLGGVQWAVIAEMETHEAMRAINELAQSLLTKGGIMILILAGLGIVIARSLSKPISSISSTMRELSGGNLNIAIPHLDRGDEIGGMAASVQVFKDNALKVEQLQAEQEENRILETARRKEEMQQLAHQFEERISSIVDHVNSEAVSLQGTAQQLAGAVGSTKQQSQVVLSSAENANGNVQSVAAAAEELSAALAEVSQTVSRTAEMCRASAGDADTSQRELDSLQTAIASVDQIINDITSVTEQTNLLALNATIEASRAGEAGKGFAVVAAEVKNLANQTAAMTKDIASKIEAVKASAKQAIGSTTTIIRAVQEIDSATTSLAAAIEEQTSATVEISRSTQEAAKGTALVSESIGSVEQAADQTAEAYAEVQSTADKLTSEAEALKKQVDAFLNEIRAA